VFLQAYCISIVWNCYKFLSQSHVESSRYDSRIHQYDTEMVRFDEGQPVNYMPQSDDQLSPVSVMVMIIFHILECDLLVFSNCMQICLNHSSWMFYVIDLKEWL
jgi:hypothetical protein